MRDDDLPDRWEMSEDGEWRWMQADVCTITYKRMNRRSRALVYRSPMGGWAACQVVRGGYGHRGGFATPQEAARWALGL